MGSHESRDTSRQQTQAIISAIIHKNGAHVRYGKNDNAPQGQQQIDTHMASKHTPTRARPTSPSARASAQREAVSDSRGDVKRRPVIASMPAVSRSACPTQSALLASYGQPNAPLCSQRDVHSTVTTPPRLSLSPSMRSAHDGKGALALSWRAARGYTSPLQLVLGRGGRILLRPVLGKGAVCLHNGRGVHRVALLVDE